MHGYCYDVPMYIEAVPNRDSPPAILLRESYREAGKVKKRTLLNLSDWPHERIAGFKALLKGVRCRVDGGRRDRPVALDLPLPNALRGPPVRLFGLGPYLLDRLGVARHEGPARLQHGNSHRRLRAFARRPAGDPVGDCALMGFGQSGELALDLGQILRDFSQPYRRALGLLERLDRVGECGDRAGQADPARG